ncbi:MAG: OmpA family protein [Candidatus Eisenbacteria bacterium]|uniref:OmpA family protein n=1 Tax=Eiseniibacteriota bacterium TaxID=2212470 RepID=A0A948W781_UNCEI|nr:OmpA family protein [Candidatus Eisenbacteria bacterium]MBU1949688.1 OmpA family protein [Candidatus Eisenbacteria bacterium]MBU2692319.1 OmpA family protein [Candidatus Eisenbacteria bacterium]
MLLRKALIAARLGIVAAAGGTMKKHLTIRFNFFTRLLFAGISIAGLLFTPAPAAGEPVNMLSLQEGALPVVIPATYGSWSAHLLLDDSPNTGWACEEGNISNNVFVFELVETTTLERFEFDNAAVDAEGAGAKEVLVEVSNTSAQTGYTTVLETTLADLTGRQSFPARTKTPARWVRLTIRNNQGSEAWTELFSFQGFGEKPAMAPPGNISGTYETSYSNFHVLQQGTALTGCYEYDEGLLEGTIEGRVMKITWREGGGPDDRGPAVMVFTPDGKTFQGFWWFWGGENEAPNGSWEGKKISAEVGGCPHWSGSVGGELKKQLSAEKRARLYGILFDTDSAVIKSESKPVLDQVLELLRTEPDWILTIEGHTDALGSDEHNLALSQKRADSVKAHLVSGGIGEGRLKSAGFGESKPVADNETELGRAQNRRVELVRE